MKIIISPAKGMTDAVEFPESIGNPIYLNKTELLLHYLKSLDLLKLKALLCCNDNIAALNYERYQKMDLSQQGTAAIVSYEGIQYQYMAPRIFLQEYYSYVQEKVRILSGFYGILKPLDSVFPYRLEMQAKLNTGFCRNLYDFWGEDIYRPLYEESVILNLASAEYSKAVKKWVKQGQRFVTCVFGERIDGKIVEKGVYVKMARGAMVRYLAEIGGENPEDAKGFDRLGFQYEKGESSKDVYVFLKKKEKEICLQKE